ncbi:Crp/Fnr family transcriptional regulator [Paludisphaera mucosa]|uniref:Crp/Fnr family transcriptional regulator n=1 Tax=Paludisphaera mucosa TaxID=3030827 RepID=A0ABT6FG72_9BACT|nr:Crp/Fnr family transcriptional regulator [Paludisphaera mucosa]MDG3006491.1 Crp/Fnr family transcriptional regulator [Paludisphaera mucosa]
MILEKSWAEDFVKAAAQVRTARRRSLKSAETVCTDPTAGRCWVVAAGYVKVVDPRPDGDHFTRLVLGRGGLFGDRPFGGRAFRGFLSPQPELSVAHGPAEVVEVGRAELEAAARADAGLASMLLESTTARSQLLERRLLWQIITPLRARMAAALRDLICFEGQRCKHGHTIDVRLSHQDLSEILGAARPVVSAELVKMRREGLIEYTRCHFCVDDLAGLDRVAGG